MIAAGLLSVLIFPATALTLLKRDPKMRAELAEAADAREGVVVPRCDSVTARWQASEARIETSWRRFGAATRRRSCGLVDEYGPALLRVARMYVPSRAVAEEVVQETWIGVLNGIDRFEGRSSLKTWIFRILVNTRQDARPARARARVPFSSAAGDAGDGPSVDPDRFLPAGDERARALGDRPRRPGPTPRRACSRARRAR